MRIRRIVCPTDFSAPAGSAVEYAAEMARAFGAELLLLHVIPAMNYPLRSFGMAWPLPNLHEELRAHAAAELEKVKQGIAPGVGVRTELRDGDAHAQVLACTKANDADLIVMGTQGHTGLRHALLGSTAERVVRLAECPVLTVRGRTDGAN
ncbi:MAG TPA: universal stress protein [Planctomycetota bacterium]|nr:universal stress protein [Planctomycetota bacterium]